MVVGAYGNGVYKGAVYVFAQQVYSPSYQNVSAPSDGTGTELGSLYPLNTTIQLKSGEIVWTQQALLTAADAAYGDNYGYSVAIWNRHLAVGSYRSKSEGGG